MKFLLFILIFIIKINIFSEFIEVQNLESNSSSKSKNSSSTKKDEKLFSDVEPPTFFSENLEKVVNNQEEIISKNDIEVDEKLNEELKNNSSSSPSIKRDNHYLLMKKLQYTYYTQKENKSLFSDFLKEYEISSQTQKIHTGHVQANEIVSKGLIDNFEFGVGTTSKSQTNEEYWNYTPIYTTTKYNLPNDNKYLKFNLGYSFDNDDILNNYRNTTLYYGIGGGMDFNSFSVDLMYQVNKDRYNLNNSYYDDSRVSLFFDYKLDN